MRKILLGIAAAASLLSLPVAVNAAESGPQARLIFGVDRADQQPTLDRVGYFYGGRQYCWYEGGWRGPGFYWCGYAWRRGFGWGGGYGWRGWRGGRVIYRGGHGRWHGGHGGWHGGHGGGHHGGHHGGGHHGHH